MASSDYTRDGDLHRFVFIPLRLENQAKATKGELVADLETGTIYVRDANGVLRSQSAEVAAKLQTLEDAGILNQAVAYENNSQIYALYVKDGVIKLDTMLKLNKNIRYWAVRGTRSDGAIQYITGTLTNGAVNGSLVDVVHDTTNDLISYTGSAQSGPLYDPDNVKDGDLYFIDFFDANRVIVSTVPGQIRKVSSLDFSLSPDTNVVALRISTNQDETVYDSDNNPVRQAFVYQGQKLSNLNVYVAAVYSNGDTRYINTAQASSRLAITYPDTTDQNNPIDSAPVGDTFTLTAKYYTTEKANATGQEYVDEFYASITQTLKVVVKEDVYTDIRYIVPVPVVNRETVGANSKRVINMRYFGMYASGQYFDITMNSRMTINRLVNDSLGVTQPFDISLTLGHSTTHTYNQSPTVNMSGNEGTFGYWKSLNLGDNVEWQNADVSRLKARFDATSDNGGRIKMDLTILNGDLSEPVNAISLSDLQAACRGKTDEGSQMVEPTHFRVRSVANSSHMFVTQPEPIANAITGFYITDDSNVQYSLAGWNSNHNNIPWPVLFEFSVYNSATEKYDIISLVPAITGEKNFTD